MKGVTLQDLAGLSFQEPVPAALTTALAGLGAGNVDNGAHTYVVTFVTAVGETYQGASAVATVVDKTADGQVALTNIPSGSPEFVTSRKIYRSAAGTTTPLKLLTTIADNFTSTYTDNIADATIAGAASAPTANTTANPLVTQAATGLAFSGENSHSGVETFTSRVKQGKGADLTAANNLSCGFDGNVFAVTGNTQINLLSTIGWAAGSEVTLVFRGTPTVKHGQAPSGAYTTIALSGSVDLVAAANTVLKLVYDDGVSAWQEVSRKVA